MIHPMFLQDVFPKVIGFFSKNGVNVIAIIHKADIVLLDDKVRCMD